MIFGQVWWPTLWICVLHLTHPSAHTQQWVVNKHTHTVNTHPEQWAAIYAAAPREKLGVGYLAQGSHRSHGIEGGKSAGYSLPPTYNPCRAWDSSPVTSPTLYPLGHDCPQIVSMSRNSDLVSHNCEFISHLWVCSQKKSENCKIKIHKYLFIFLFSGGLSFNASLRNKNINFFNKKILQTTHTFECLCF